MLKGAMLLFGNPKLGSHTAANVGAGFGVVGVTRTSVRLRTPSISA